MGYYEQQYMIRDQLFLIPVICIVSFIGWYFFIIQVIMGVSIGNHPAPDWAVWILFIIFGILFPAFFVILRLETRIVGENLEFRFFPAHLSWRTIPFADIEEIESTEYRPIREFGGWGIRLGRRGKAYTVSGNRGVRITMKNGRKFILGSKNADELESAIKTG